MSQAKPYPQLSNTCCFTGHRPEMLPWGEDETNLDAIACREALVEKIQSVWQDGCVYFMSGMARGIDLMAAETVLELKADGLPIELQCIIPYRQQMNGFPPKDQDRYRSILQKADTVTVLEERYTKTCLLERNCYMVDHSKYVIAVYNQSGKGGTFHAVRYAMKNGRKLMIIHPESLGDNPYCFF